MREIFFSTVAAAAVAFLVVMPSACGEKEDPAAVLKTRAEARYAEGKYDDAVRLYDKLSVDYPAYAAAEKVRDARKRAEAKGLFEVARKLARSGRDEEAEEALRDALALAPDDADVNYGVGWVYIETALRYRSRAQATKGPARGNYMAFADASADLARERFERSVKLSPEHWAGYRGMAVYHLYRGEYDEALEALADAQKYSKKPEDDVAVERLRVQVYVDQKKFAQAKEVIDRLVEKYPERGETYSALAEYYIGAYYVSRRESDVDEAIKALEVGVTKKFEDRATRNGAYSLLSRLRLSKGDYDGALSAAKAALADDPFNDLFAEQYAAAWQRVKSTERRR
ncbi:MAG: tetratricopeptide repeat protein [candidate division Zixibacteria bacterium]|nr:tetratricopeptide repeat protein [candidate division Zixibacteria bacterium]